MIRVAIALMIGLSGPIIKTHDQWSDGTPVPDWVKAECCGPDDVHRLESDQIQRKGDQYVVSVDGLTLYVPEKTALPSQDGYSWIFFKKYPDGSVSKIYCFFIPSGV